MLALCSLAGTALAFNTTYVANFASASSQYANKTSPTSVPSGSGARTISAWIKTTTTGTCYYDSGTDAGTLQELELCVDVLAGTADFGVALNGGNVHYTATNIEDGSWHHLVFVYDGGGVGIATGGHAYMDGNALTQAGTNNQIPNTSSACIGMGAGACQVTPGAFFNGRVDDLRIWSRALSSSEVSSLFSSPCTFSNGANFVSWYQLENNFTDSQGSNSMTAVNTPTFVTGDNPYACAAAVAHISSPILTPQWIN